MIKVSLRIFAIAALMTLNGRAYTQIFDDLDVPAGSGVIITHTAFSDAIYYRVDLSNAATDMASEPIVVEAPNWNKKSSLFDPNLKKRKRSYYGVKIVPEGEYALVNMTASTGSHLSSSNWIWCFNQEADVFRVEKGKITVMPPRVYRIIKDPPLDIDADENFETITALIQNQSKVLHDIEKAQRLKAIKFQAENDKECKISDTFTIADE